ncbi:YbaB/EbfC family nucleoid-associated protein [Mycobacterium sp. 050134]|uniref:YbaB/EbfC family nucleoid-associated protein n=1 Tax=Mycobacterium sp. 050134 TaxID=3096111 RepID=UPI002EDB9FA5
MDNDAAAHDFDHVLALVQEQMLELSSMQQKRAMLSGAATTADGTVEVTVDAQRMVTKITIDESYLEDFDFADLGGHITAAAQQATQEVERQAAALMAPLARRRQEISSLAGSSVDIPDFGELLGTLNAPAVPEPRLVDNGDEDVDDGTSYPTVRR